MTEGEHRGGHGLDTTTVNEPLKLSTIADALRSAFTTAGVNPLPPPQLSWWGRLRTHLATNWARYAATVFSAAAFAFLMAGVFSHGVENTAWGAMSLGSSAMSVALCGINNRHECRPRYIIIKETK